VVLQIHPWMLQTLPRARSIIRYSYILLYVIRTMNRCIIRLILIKCYVMLIIGLILLIMIKDVMRCLCELCFGAKKLVIWIVWIMIFLGKELMNKEIVFGCVSSLSRRCYLWLVCHIFYIWLMCSGWYLRHAIRKYWMKHASCRCYLWLS
jgi:hypothetical protein